MSNKNVLCLSWCDADEVVNYGQILQALAMMKLLRTATSGKIKYISYRNRSLREYFDYYVYHLNFFNGHIQAYIKTLKTIHKIINENDIQFHQVMNKNKLNDLAKNYEILLCGSDQIWHPQNYDENYFLHFSSNEQKKIAFGASLPKTYCEISYSDKYELIKDSLKSFDAIAVREQSSVAFVKELASRRNVVSVLDPTFLVEKSFWKELVEPIDIEEPYIFIYIPNGMNKDLVDIVNRLKINTKIKSIYVLLTRGTNLFTDTKTLKFVSLGQFLYLINNAAFVVTSSFHAVVFSSIFHTNFYAYDIPNESRGEDCRLSDVLSVLGLSDRHINSNYNIHEIVDIDYCDVENRLLQKRKESIEFLFNQLSY